MDEKAEFDFLKKLSTIEEASRIPLTNLPKDILVEIMKFLIADDAKYEHACRTLSKLKRTCKYINAVGKSEQMQKSLDAIKLTNNQANEKYIDLFNKKKLNLANLTDLIKKGINLNLLNENGSPLLIDSIIKRNMELIDFLLANGADVGVTDYKGTSALMVASYHYYEPISKLINHNANINHQDEDGLTILMIAIQLGRTELAKSLIDLGADINLKNKKAETAFILAGETNKSEIIPFLYNAGALINEQNKVQKTALMLASASGHYNVVKILMMCHPDVNLKDKNNDTAFTLAAARNIDAEILKLLFPKIDNIDHKNKKGDTALIRAARNGHMESVNFLIENHADKNLKNKKNQTAAEIAEENKHRNIAKILKSDKL